LRERISKLIGTELTFSACIRLVPPQSIARTEMGKAKRVVKEYQENVGRE
jgi:phenylacetate-coenzyme A ligase PaaK-like adenylate-forming protein